MQILAAFSGEIEMEESYCGGRREGERGRWVAGKVPVCGILERGGKVTVEVVSDVQVKPFSSWLSKIETRTSIIHG
jgi:transposase-like protein